jgi:hypothetical protein
MENHHAINGKTHYKWPFSIAILTLPEGTHHFPHKSTEVHQGVYHLQIGRAGWRMLWLPSNELCGEA